MVGNPIGISFSRGELLVSRMAPSFRPSVFLKYVQLFVRKVFQGMFGEHRFQDLDVEGLYEILVD